MRFIHSFTTLILILCITGMLFPREYRFATGSKEGTYYVVAKSLNALKKFKINPVVTAGSGENIRLIGTGKADIGMTQVDILLSSDQISYAITDNVKLLLPLYHEEIHFLTKTEIKTLKQFAQGVISSGLKNSGNEATSKIIFDAMKTNAFISNLPATKSFGTDESFSAVKSGKIDGMILVAGIPVSIFKTGKNTPVHLLPFNGDFLDYITSDRYPYRSTIIKKETYPWLKEDVTTLYVDSVMIVNKNFSDDDVRDIIEAIIAGQDKLKKIHPKWMEFSLGNASRMIAEWGPDTHPAVIPIIQDMLKMDTKSK